MPEPLVRRAPPWRLGGPRKPGWLAQRYTLERMARVSSDDLAVICSSVAARGRPPTTILRPASVPVPRVVLPLFLATLGGCAEPEDRDLLLVTLDTLRADHPSTLGFSPVETPALDALGNRGAVFELHYSVANVTGPSHASMFTRKFPREFGMRRNGIPLADWIPSLPEALSRRSYATAAFLSAGVLASEYGFDRGFDHFDEDFGIENGEPIYERPGEETCGSTRSGPTLRAFSACSTWSRPADRGAAPAREKLERRRSSDYSPKTSSSAWVSEASPRNGPPACTETPWANRVVPTRAGLAGVATLS